ncbi:spore germination protein [Bacillus sp. FJAT-47783]|uniref:spore germination protein n=1 Tax=Bacillus sp. FJAT-47783 TaxID=2922712 RepID=UPI001FAB8F30|nr:spore germination protein [Bacillus sp. FJAT-47783]
MGEMYKQNWKKKDSVTEMMSIFRTSADFTQFDAKTEEVKYWISYFRTLVDVSTLHDNILKPMHTVPWKNLEELKQILPIEGMIITMDTDVMKEKVLDGFIMIALSEYGSPCLLVQAKVNKAREVTLPEVEFTVVGPKEAFVESIESNINMIRKRIPIQELRIRLLKLGKISKTKIAVVYIEGIANDENVKTVWQRINDIEMDQINDSSYVSQMISDNNHSPFPQMLDTERPDRVAAILSEGKVAVIVDGSPHVLIAPTTLVEFFSSFEDYFSNWLLASFFRIIRLFAVAFSIFATPIYVATMNYHYELIPSDMLNTLITSRREVPLTPLLEALFLELTIELLREAGARLPTKVGQTIGIVGGIVIGTASVEAGLTSNILLIIVALAALASFTTPVYKMGNTIRLIRFPFLFFAEMFGLLGIVLCFSFITAHLLRLTSLGRPFLEPIYPPRLHDLKDAIIRFPFSMMTKRPQALRTEHPDRMNPKNSQKNKEVDE